MKSVFIDTNILIDLLADRKPFSKDAERILLYARDKEVQLYVSSHTIVTTHYVLKKYLAEKELRAILSELLEYLTVIPINQQILTKSLRSKFSDFEDAVQYFSALSINDVSCIITRNIKDFKQAEIAVLAPDQFNLD
jgi:predicted nucleic acid-binding protein